MTLTELGGRYLTDWFESTVASDLATTKRHRFAIIVSDSALLIVGLVWLHGKKL